MIEITSFLLKHLYELMADDYNARHSTARRRPPRTRIRTRTSRSRQATGAHRSPIRDGSQLDSANQDEFDDFVEDEDQDDDDEHEGTSCALARLAQGGELAETSREQETNQQIVSFLANNHLPDLICETFIELLFICVFLAVSWIFVMIVQLHCHQQASAQPAKVFYCNTKFLSSLMYCNNKSHLAAH